MEKRKPIRIAGKRMKDGSRRYRISIIDFSRFKKEFVFEVLKFQENSQVEM